jgi:P-type conjugative transfer ATPase TrbB
MSGEPVVSHRDIMLSRARDNIVDLLGNDVARWQAEEDCTDIMLNPPLPGEEHGRIWVSLLGRPREPVGYMSHDQAKRLIGAVAASMGKEVTVDTPYIEGALITDGSRFTGSIPPMVDAPFFAIRRRASRVFPFSEYVVKGQLTDGQRIFLEDAIARRENILICGGTGSGKSTFMNACTDGMVRIHPHHRFFGIEDTVELQCAAMDQVFTRTTPSLDIRALVRVAMRSFADRILIGEARGPEMLDILMAWNTGHEGGAVTIHSNTSTPRKALERVEDMLLQANPTPMPRLIGGAVNIIVCMVKHRVTMLARVRGHDGSDYQIELHD